MGHSPPLFGRTLVGYHSLDMSLLKDLEEHSFHQASGLPQICQLVLNKLEVTILPAPELFSYELANIFMILPQSGLPFPL